ncbi:RNA-directed DNA polymerase, eukaryota [Artemisia annua]|uniref:RNA-directed DNA polymerase, eukaryota n=1 Tax=Artemisia annua TaxID=35608 RepID=A0A2U1NRV3_ARTAN|nr:RNA-directed DNA polymerase, eukaryota [Artemisia annua]
MVTTLNSGLIFGLTASLFNPVPRVFALETFKNCMIAARFLNGDWNWQWHQNPRNGVESSQLSALVDALTNVSFNDEADKWVWNIENSHIFSVSNARQLIDDINIPSGNPPTKWSKFVPIKINIFAWRLLLNRLPTKTKLNDRDIDVPNILCSMCNEVQGDASHIFLHCEVSSQVWVKIAQWTDLSFPQWLNIEDFWSWIADSQLNGKQRIIIEVIALSTLWSIWRYRNSVIFQDSRFRKYHIIDSFVVNFFDWLSSRFKKYKLDWTLRLQFAKPYVFLVICS